MNRIMRHALLGAALIAAPVAASPEAEVEARLQRFLELLFNNQRRPLSELVTMEGSISEVQRTESGRRLLKSSSWREFAEEELPRADIMPAVRLQVERQEVRIEEALAAVWGRYRLFAEGREPLCLTAETDLIHVDGTWKVLNVTIVSDTTCSSQ